MITLQPISENNFNDVLKLKATEDFVAPNWYSLADAYVSLKQTVDEGKPPHLAEMPFAILHDKTVVGFAMMCFEDGKDIDADGEIFWLSRFMIDEMYQRKGYGRAAMKQLIDLVKAKLNDCEAKQFYTAYVPVNQGAAKMYAGLGFLETGQVFGGETVARLVL